MGKNKNTKKSESKVKLRLLYCFVGFIAVLFILIVILAKIQIVDSEFYQTKGTKQQTKDVTLEAKRGTIYDRNGNALAFSFEAYTIYCCPKKIDDNLTDERKEELITLIASTLSMEEKEVRKKIESDYSKIMIKKFITYEEIEPLLNIPEIKTKEIVIEKSMQRYYPNGNFLSQVLGSVTTENTGRTGLELQYDQYLSGINGRWIKQTDVYGNELANGQEEYYEAVDGYNVVTTIDSTIQYYVEEALESALKSTKAEKIMCIVMDPKTGDILASAVTGGFDPNYPTLMNSESEQTEFESLTDSEKTNILLQKWRNPLVSDVYEPGSTFKTIIAASALEEGSVTTDTTLTCNGEYTISDRTIHCDGNEKHGKQVLKEMYSNSCNICFAIIAGRLGKTNLYKYLDLFGITEKTGIDYPGEANSIVKNIDTVGSVEMATMGYGLGIALTPIQLITAVNAIANDGVLMEPRYVSCLTDSDGNIVEEYEPKEVRQVISSETAKEVLECLKYSVENGSAKSAKVLGYSIGGKTGTANKINSDGTGYSSYTMASFIGVAPADDPEISILVIVDSSKNKNHGATVAAPIAKEILSNVLPYLNIGASYTKKEIEKMEKAMTKVPDVIGKDLDEAIKILEENNLKYQLVTGVEKGNWEVVDQYPKSGTKVSKNTKIYLYKE